MGRILGVDFGLRRLGFAVSDPDRILATPLCVRECSSAAQAVEATARLAAEQEADLIVVGLPLNMDGTAGPIAEKVEAFKQQLAKKTKRPIELWDERLTSKSAEDVLIQAGTRRKKRKEVIDKLAARIMLQHYIDAHEQRDEATGWGT